MGQDSLITSADVNRVLTQIEELVADIIAHRDGGLEKHSTHQVINAPYLDSNGVKVSDRSLKIGAKINGVPVFVLIPCQTKLGVAPT